KVELKTLNTSKATVFYKTGKSKKDLLLSKWDARNTVSENFEVKENSFYEFLVVFDYESPLTCIEMFEVSEAAKNLD
ncbi:hypothetical protein, partial [Lishizhenia sp.]|uniref:hypothetical protein n=1 Tax=Lishizhenia sp. TaxID=2497594 RepID=UPI00299D61C6